MMEGKTQAQLAKDRRAAIIMVVVQVLVAIVTTLVGVLT